jgi:RHS repeat-associated protein
MQITNKNSTYHPPFGSLKASRNASTSNYRFGFNSMEADKEVKGDGNHYTTHFRQYDSRLGRWFSIDPESHKFPGWSPYVFSFNSPIILNDPNGDCPPGVDCDDPVANPQITSPGVSGKAGGRFGKTRESKTQMHNGIDITAKVGTALKSIMGGKVVELRTSITGYKKGSVGNYVVVKTIVDGENVYIKYNHLESVSVKKDDQVEVGGLLGKTGKTGNAGKLKPDKTHVHIEASKSKDRAFFAPADRVNPESYLKTKFDSNSEPIPETNESVKSTNSEDKK